MTVRKFLDCSVVHLSSSTVDALDDGAYCLMHGFYGWLVHVPDTEELEVELGLPDDLRAVVAYARKQECAYVMFDADAPEIAGLPTYEKP